MDEGVTRSEVILVMLTMAVFVIDYAISKNYYYAICLYGTWMFWNWYSTTMEQLNALKKVALGQNYDSSNVESTLESLKYQNISLK